MAAVLVEHTLTRSHTHTHSTRGAALNAIREFLSSDDCHLRSLCLADSHLRDGCTIILEALAENSSLRTLNIR